MDTRTTTVAVFVDLTFFLNRYRQHCSADESPLRADSVANATAMAHLDSADDKLYRIFVYDCRPLAKKAHNPVTRRAVDFSRTATFVFRSELLRELVRLRKVAVRLGELAAGIVGRFGPTRPANFWAAHCDCKI